MRRIIHLFHDHAGEGFSKARVSVSTDVDMELASTILATLAQAFVLDCSGEPPTYCFAGDRALQIEFDRFLRSSGRHAGAVRDNVEKFRQRYSR